MEILFRGQTRRKGEKVYIGTGEPVESNWVYGGIFPQNKGGDFSIIYSYDPIEKHVVYANTVCQYTGLTDKNGNKVFENDIVTDADSRDIGVVKFGIYNSKHYGFYIEWKGNCQYRKDIYYWINNNRVTVIGNIFDNLELLEKEARMPETVDI